MVTAMKRYTYKIIFAKHYMMIFKKILTPEETREKTEYTAFLKCQNWLEKSKVVAETKLLICTNF